jgi:4-hydroxy-tetrahydrodipicolinate reductase
MIKVCISGIGKTGKEIARALLEQDNMKVVSAICSPSSSKKGKDLGELLGCQNTGIIVEGSDNLKQIIFRTRPDVVVDFSTPEAALRNAKIFSLMKVNMVIGTTGFSKMALKKLFILAKNHHTGIVYSPNITMGVNVLMLFSNLAANILNNYDFQITEIHHKYKKDSPSGTAIKIAAEIEKGLASSGIERDNYKTPIYAVRAGGVVGKHEVMIIGENDKIEISHESFSRKAFALGAIRAINFVVNRPGYFEMNDVLDLKKVLNDYLEKDRNSLSRKYENMKRASL